MNSMVSAPAKPFRLLSLVALAFAVPGAVLAQSDAAGADAGAQESDHAGPSRRVADEQQGKQQDEPDQDPTEIRVVWRDGLRMETVDGRFQLSIGGRAQLDTAFFADEDAFDGLFGKLENATEVRRARLHLQGYMYGSVDYKFELDFAGGRADIKDLYLGVRNLPVKLRFGHQKEPWSIEQQTSSRFITFMERSLAIVFSPERNFGARVERNMDGRTSWAAGVFRETDGFAGVVGDNYNLTGRVTHAPILDNDGRNLLHLGVGYTHKLVDGALTLELRPDVHTGPKLIQLVVPATSADYLQGEVAANIGSLAFQAEYVQAWIKSTERNDPSLNGWYVQGSYFLTGESRPYTGTLFNRVKPRHNFLDGGSGAWQIAARYARADLSEGTESGLGVLAAFTAGLNWHWNPNVRLMFNFTRTNITDLGTDPTSIYQWRVSFNL
jgi:phosphate-selective porin OprO/OprP